MRQDGSIISIDELNNFQSLRVICPEDDHPAWIQDPENEINNQSTGINNTFLQRQL